MVNNQWVVSIEKTIDGHYVMSFAGKLYLKLSSLIGLIFGLGTIIAAIRNYFS